MNRATEHLDRLQDDVVATIRYEERLKKLIHLYEYVLDTPILIETQKDFREDVWNRLNVLEELLTQKLQKLCYGTSTEEEINARDERIHILICHAMFVINDIRTKYY